MLAEISKWYSTEDKKYENNNPHVQKQVKAAKAEAKKRTEESKYNDYYARVDGKNKTVTIEETNKPKGFNTYFVRNVIQNPLESGYNFYEAGKALFHGDVNGALKNAATGVGNLLSPLTLGVGSWAGENYTKYSRDVVQYGTKQEVENRKNTENAIIKTGIDTIVTFNLPKKIGNGKITLPQIEPAVTINSSGVLTRVSTPAITLTGGGKTGVALSNVAKVASNSNDNKNNRSKSEKLNEVPELVRSAKELKETQIRNMSLDEIKKIGEVRNSKNSIARYLDGTNEDAIKFFESRIIREETIKRTPKGVIRIGYDKFGNKVVYKSFSSKVKSVPTIDFYEIGKKNKIKELKFD